MRRFCAVRTAHKASLKYCEGMCYNQIYKVGATMKGDEAYESSYAL
ncbi:hypothetical protein HMPREF9555_02134 [Selenomonas artemidis F0399]|uniref:Uncharacterized protein n=1 Tax=Selenomonas artemidis F0399 TaxID=749551 RepID=E7N539_9FIRM|nr:hypothetical protein HMPREF9555_02134 [Selenomonas artemidis F0399]